MAASVPAQKAPGWSAAPSSSQDGGNTSGLEIGMSGMSLVSTLSGGSRPPALSGSSVSTGGDAHGPLNVDNADPLMGLTPPSPASPHDPGAAQSTGSQGSFKPPGLGLSLPSPIGKSSTASNTNVSSPHLSLTPPSLDGNIDFFNMGKQSSPYFETGSLPTPPNLDQSGESGQNSRSNASWSEQQMNKSEVSSSGLSDSKNFLQGNLGDESLSNSYGGIFSTGSFDPADQDDGLHGLSALTSRDRSHSSPGPFPSLAGQGSGPYSSSPVLYRESSPVHGDSSVGSKEDFSGARGPPQDQRRSRPLPNGKTSSRPPLSGGGSSANFPQSQDGAGSAFGSIQGDRAASAMSTASNVQHSGYSGDVRQHGLGSISRPELRYSVSDVAVDKLNGRGRSMSLGASGFKEYREPPRSVRDPYGDSYQQQMEQLHAQKFGAPQPFNSHIQQQRMPPVMNQSQNQQMQQLPHGRHVRSFSQPGPLQHERHGNGHDDALRYGLGQFQNGVDDRRDPGFGSQQRHLVEGDSASSLDGTRYGRFPHSHISRSASAGANLTQVGGSGLLPRSGNVSQPTLSSSLYEGHSQGKSSFQPHVQHNAGGPVMFSGHGGPQSQGRQLPEYQGGRVSGYEDAAIPVMATPEEMRIHGIGAHDGLASSGFRHERLVSPSHSPLNMTVGGHPGHIRHYSDGTGMSASPISIGSARGAGFGPNKDSHSNHHDSGHHRNPSFDDDLTHPLAGEHIDDPEDDLAHHGAVPGHYGGDPTAFHGHQKGLPHDQGLPMGVGRYPTMDAVHHHHHSAASASPGPKAVYNVKFKRTQRCFIVGPRITRDLKIGCYVKVEADRGEDLGIVVSKIPADKFNSAGRSSFRGSGGELTAGALPTAGAGTTGAADLKRIIRLATHDEVSLLAVKREEEEELLKICRGKVRQRGLPMHVVDAEYQFDRHKLTFFFEAEGRIDFRELVRDLFSMYKTRIWMQQLDKNGSSSAGAGIVTPSSASVEGGHPSSSKDEGDEADPVSR